MSRPTVPALILFGSTANPASEIGQFGSFQSPDYSGSLAVMQSGTAWPRGWFASVKNTNRQFIQDQNAVDFVFCSYLFYIMTLGIPEYITAMTYWTNSIIQVAGQLFTSITDNNTGNAPATSPTQWQSGIPGAEISGAIKPYAGSISPSGYLICNGQAVSRTTYATLFNICSTNYGIGDGTTTFNVPDLRGKIPVAYLSGDPNFGTLGVSGGQASVILGLTNMPNGYYLGQAGGSFRSGTDANAVLDPIGGSGTPVPTIPPFQTVGCYIIKT